MSDPARPASATDIPQVMAAVSFADRIDNRVTDIKHMASILEGLLDHTFDPKRGRPLQRAHSFTVTEDAVGDISWLANRLQVEGRALVEDVIDQHNAEARAEREAGSHA